MRTCALYDSTVKTIGFDEIRVRYRQQRRNLIKEIIISQLTGGLLDEYISTKTAELVKEEDRQLFVEDVKENLREIDRSRIAGLGITLEQLDMERDAELESMIKP